MRLDVKNRKLWSCRLAAVVVLLCTATRLTRAQAATATQPTGLEFLQGDAGRTAIIDDSSDPYFARLADHEMTAKTSSPITGKSHDEKIAECKKRYQAAVVDFKDNEKQALTFFVSKIQPVLLRDYPVFGNLPFSFIKSANSLEGGMAWTRGSHIILPTSMLNRLAMFQRMLGDRAVPTGASLLIHEQTHVLQRLHPQLFTPLYTDTFHFVHADRIATNSWLTDRQLINPDGTVCDWIFPLTGNGDNSFILPLIAFNSPNPSNLSTNMGTIAVTMEKTADGFKPVLGTDGNPVVRPLNEVTEYMKGPGSEGNNYHPNEIAADRFAELVVMDDLVDAKTRANMTGDDPDKLEQRLKPMRDWARTAFAQPVKNDR